LQHVPFAYGSIIVDASANATCALQSTVLSDQRQAMVLPASSVAAAAISLAPLTLEVPFDRFADTPMTGRS